MARNKEAICGSQNIGRDGSESRLFMRGYSFSTTVCSSLLMSCSKTNRSIGSPQCYYTDVTSPTAIATRPSLRWLQQQPESSLQRTKGWCTSLLWSPDASLDLQCNVCDNKIRSLSLFLYGSFGHRNLDSVKRVLIVDTHMRL